MKQICTQLTGASNFAVSKKTIIYSICLLLFAFPFTSIAQSGSGGGTTKVIPELIFQNPVLVSGTTNQEGAIYRFSNVATDIDALLEIKKISDASTVINNMDVNNMGWNKAFQPELGRTGTVSSFQNWWVRFRITFVKAGTTNKVTLSKFYVTALDVDGDNVSIQEYVQMQNADSIKLSPVTNLALTTPLDFGLLNNQLDKLTQGPVRNFTNIDTAATLVMATYTYLNANDFDFTIGGKSGAASSTVGLRLNSLWFKSFSLAPQVSQSILPLHLLNFQGNVNGSKSNLQWTVAENETGYAFELEKSYDGKNFNTAALVFTTTKTGTENYSYKEEMNRSAFYRLKMINKDNSISYSKIIKLSVEKEAETNQIRLLQNPVASSLQFTYVAAENSFSNISIYTASGTKLFSTQLQSQKGTNTYNVSLDAKIKTGIYLLEIVNNNQQSISKFIKQ
jgi:hypothetical protein